MGGAVGGGVCGEFVEGSESDPGGCDGVFALCEEGFDASFGGGDGAVDDAEEFGEHASGYPVAAAEDGDQEHVGQGECGWVATGGFAPTGSTASDVQFGFPVGLVGQDEFGGQGVPVGGGDAGERGRCSAAGAAAGG